eukprot:Skav209330  [mRNA]  locus=scaffold724:434726:435145:- [translate_table: standard]
MPPVWQKMLARSSEKRTTFIQRQVAIFTRNFQEAVTQSKGKDINMMMRAPNMQDSVPEAYDIGACWVHFAGEFKEKLGKPLFKKAQQSFLRGSYDREFVKRQKIQQSGVNISPSKNLATSELEASTARNLDASQSKSQG